MLDNLDPRARDLLVASRRFSRLQMPRIDAGDGTVLKPNEVFLMMSLRHSHKIGAQGLGTGETPDLSAGIKPSELAVRLGVTAGSITQMLTPLESRELIHRDRDIADRRVVRVRLTEKGVRAMDSALQSMGIAFSGLAEALGDAESAHFVRLLEKANEYLGTKWNFGHGHHCPAPAGAREPDVPTRGVRG